LPGGTTTSTLLGWSEPPPLLDTQAERSISTANVIATEAIF